MVYIGIRSIRYSDSESKGKAFSPHYYHYNPIPNVFGEIRFVYSDVKNTNSIEGQRNDVPLLGERTRGPR